MADVHALHDAVRRGDLAAMRALLDRDRTLANATSATDPRVTCPLHVAAEFGRAPAAALLLDYGADVARRDRENDAIPPGRAAFFGRPAVVAVLLRAGSEPSQRNRHGLTPLGCAVGGSEGRWRAPSPTPPSRTGGAPPSCCAPPAGSSRRRGSA